MIPFEFKGELVFTSLTKEAFPVIRYRTGDIASLNPEPCRCGRKSLRMSRIKGRIDDMLIIRGVNVFPTEIEAVLLGYKELAPYYQVVIEREGALDRFEIHCEVTPEFVEKNGRVEESPVAGKLVKSILNTMKNALGVSVVLSLKYPGSLIRSEGKAIRVIDNRNKAAVK